MLIKNRTYLKRTFYLHNMKPSNEQFLCKIKEDISKTGFVSELKAAQIAKSKDWRVQHNSNYLDFDTGKSREFDLSVSTVFSNPRGFTLHIQLNIEVKKSKKPWVVFTEEIDSVNDSSDLPGFGLVFAYNNFSTSEVLDYEGIMDGFMRLDKKYIGRNFCEAFKDPDEPSKIYEALVSISKASLYSRELNMSEKAKEQEDDPSSYYDPEIGSYFHIIQPVVILEGSLIAASLGHNGEIVLQETEYIPLSIEYTSKYYERKRFFPDIITLDYFSEYLDKSDYWGNQISKNVKL